MRCILGSLLRSCDVFFRTFSAFFKDFPRTFSGHSEFDTDCLGLVCTVLPSPLINSLVFSSSAALPLCGLSSKLLKLSPRLKWGQLRGRERRASEYKLSWKGPTGFLELWNIIPISAQKQSKAATAFPQHYNGTNLLAGNLFAKYDSNQYDTLDWVAWLVADPLRVNSMADTDIHTPTKGQNYEKTVHD